MRRLIGLTLTTLALSALPATALAHSTAAAKLRVVVGGGTVGVISVSSSRGRHQCLIDCTYSYAVGTRVTIRAQPAANVTRFVRWSGACAGTKRTCTLTLHKNAAVTAKFALGG